MDRARSWSAELLKLEKVTGHQKVLQWLEANLSNNDGTEEEEEADRHQELKQSKDKMKVQWLDLFDSTSYLGFNVGENVLSKGKSCRDQDLSEGEDAIDKPLGLVDDKDPLEGPSGSKNLGTEVAGEAAHVLPGASPSPWSHTDAAPARAAEEEQPPEPVAAFQDQVREAQHQLSKERPSRFRRVLWALRELCRLFCCPCLVPQPEE